MGFFDSVLSIATCGVSDLVQGNSMGSGALDLINDIVPSHTFVGKLLPSIGAAIGTIVYPVAGTALGYGIGAHLAGQNSTQALTGAGMAAIAGWAGGALSQGLGGATGKLAGNAASTAIKLGGSYLKNALMTDPNAVNRAWENMPNYEKMATVNSYKTSGLLKPTDTPDYFASDNSTQTPSFEKSALPKLADYDESKDKKIAEALTDEYKNYKLNDYMLYKQDPEHLQELILKYA